MIRRRSRLHRRLGVDFPVFEVALPGAGLSWDDDQVLGLSLVRGGDETGPGLVTCTATIDVRDTVPPQHDQPVSVALTPAGADHLAALVGNRTAAELTGRWYGRLGRGTVTDAPRDELRRTQFAAADWLTELTRTKQPIPGVASGDALPTIISKALTAAALPFTWTMTRAPLSLGAWTQSVGAGTHQWEEVVKSFLVDAGAFVHQTRAGGFHATNLVSRKDAAVALADLETYEPLTRRQCRPAATWEQPTSDPALVSWSYAVAGSGGTDKEFRKGSGTRTIREQVTDVSELVYWQDSAVVASFDYSMEGRAYRLGGWGYQVPSVSIDLLRLLSSPLEADRRMAGQLLTYDPGDPILLLHDWPDEVKGYHVVTGTTETITKDGWEVELSLAPAVQLFGSIAEPVYPPPPLGLPAPVSPFAVPEGLTWDTGRPRTETWDTIPDHDWNGA